MFLIFDTETTGLPQNYNAPLTDFNNWPRMVQLAWQLHDAKGKLLSVKNYIVKPDGYDIPYNAQKIHGISTQRAQKQGLALDAVLEIFEEDLAKATFLVGHNIGFDLCIVGSEFLRQSKKNTLENKASIDTKDEATNYCALSGGRGGKYKWPTLSELHLKLFNQSFEQAHNAAADVEATARCFLELVRLGIIKKKTLGFSDEILDAFQKANPTPIEAIGLNTPPYDANELEHQTEKSHLSEEKKAQNVKENTDLEALKRSYFQFHNHTCFSVLSATTEVQQLIGRAVQEQMPAVGITDHGNMMGAFTFISTLSKVNKERQKQNQEIENGLHEGMKLPLLKGIIGCELYLSEQYLQKKFTKDQPDKRYTQVLLAKNKIGYHNLSKLSSYGFIDGYYAGYPRINKALVQEHKEGLIATTGSLSSEVPNQILNLGETLAERAFLWWLEVFGDDFYIELNRHGSQDEDYVNEVLLKWADKHQVKYLAQNNTYYLDKKDAHAHDILLCVRDGEKQATPIGRGRGYRFGFEKDEFYFKNPEQMIALFKDKPEAILNLNHLIEKIEPYTLEQEVLLPNFDIPEAFIDPKDQIDGGKRGENAYLKHLTYQGAQKRYPALSPELKERIDFELETIEKTGYPGYFLIVQDFTNQARKMGVWVGPGRGSAAGSVVAYCTGITNIDPIRYDLLFERFLNPDRVSLPDIDIDFDDRGRETIIQWVVEKYGKHNVAQIITYGTMAAKSAIRDTGRVLDLPLPETDRLAKMTPDMMKLKKLFALSEKDLTEKLDSDNLQRAKSLILLSKEDSLEAQTLNQARVIEGSLRNTGTHACGVIITPKDIREYIPVAVAKDTDWLVTQFDNAVVERAGLLKMDFLGLKTLTLLKDAVALIKKNKQIELDIDAIPLDDEATYTLFQRGDTIGIFQYESVGMQKYLRQLRPDKFDDLIAMNALYRPGPLQYIPNFIARKHGQEPITYDLPAMEEYLKDTYGITVYQEQVMLLSQKLAGFSKGNADVLRKAMGKKQKEVLDKMKQQFIEGAVQNGHPEEKLEKIWRDWEAFASYAFNKSHSTCYAYLAYQTAYLKANYPAEYMASVLSNNMSDIKQVSMFMEACRAMNIPVLGPDVNESDFMFSVNQQGQIRFGMGAVKGVGESAVESILKEREKNGSFLDIFDFVKRIDLQSVNKKTMESLTLAGAFDTFGAHRAQYFHQEGPLNTIEHILRFGSKYQQSKAQAQASLFDDFSEDIAVVSPQLPQCDTWSPMVMLSKEKEVIGMYLTAHPLEGYKYEMAYFTNLSLDKLSEGPLNAYYNREICVAGIISHIEHKISRNGRNFGAFTLEDFKGSKEFVLFGEDYLRNKHLLIPKMFLFLKMQIRPGRDNLDDFISITQIHLLEDIMEKMCREVQIHIRPEDINESLTNQLLKTITEHTGSTLLSFCFSGNKKAPLELKSALRVSPKKTFFDDLSRYKQIQVALKQ